jgi:hypothetical protein
MPSALVPPSVRRSRNASDLLKRQVRAAIQLHGPITASEIANRIPVLSDDPVRIVRKKIRDLIMTDRIPIASSMERPFGYFIVQPGSEEADAYVLQLRGRLEKIAQRLARFRSSSAARIQGVLFEEFGPSTDQSNPTNPSDSVKEASCPE